jgi:hypothetical protein
MLRFIFCILSVFASMTHAAESKFGTLVLLQPESVLQERELNIEEFATFIKAAQTSAELVWKTRELTPSSGFLVIAVREGGKVNAWVDFEPALPQKVDSATTKAIRFVPAFHVSKGTVVFAIKVAINGASETKRQTPMPKEWKSVSKSQLLPVELENLVKLAWP